MSFAKEIKVLLVKKNMNLTSLSKQLNKTLSTMSDKLRRDNLRESDIREIADAVNCDYELVFIDRETGKRL